jgi:hypothetical protein
MTNNVEKREMKHNGLISGGAKATRGRVNTAYCVVAGLEDKKDACQLEWRIKHPNNKRKVPSTYHGVVGRIKGLNLVLNSDRYRNRDFTVWITEDMLVHLDLPDNIAVYVVDKLDLAEI